MDNSNSMVTHYEYKRTIGDAGLELIKKIISNPESRHDLLPLYAHLKSLIPPRHFAPQKLEKTLQFKDRSMPITMASPIILSAGGNKAGKNLRYFPALGFGGVTVGSATINPHLGNPFRPRVRMLPEDFAINNSMGLNNPGIEAIAHAVDFNLGLCHRRKMSLGISIAETPGLTQNDQMIKDMLAAFRKAYRAADYVEINVSCPNTGVDRIDLHKGFLESLLKEIMSFRKSLAPRKAVFVKLSPDMSQKLLQDTLQIIADNEVTGLVLFNTFPAGRAKYLEMNTPEDKILPVAADGRKGGISGRILYKNTLPAIRYIKKQLPQLSLLAVGGIDHGEKVLDLLEAGADAVQCYTVMAYRYNAIAKMNRELVMAMENRGYRNLQSLGRDNN